MTQQGNFRSAGVNTRTIDLIGPTGIQPFGTPAGVIGTAKKGPAFVPTIVATQQDFVVEFGASTNDAYQGPLAANEWLANQQALSYIRVLGIGTGEKRLTSGGNEGSVEGAGFIVGDQQPQYSGIPGNLGDNPYANAGGELGRTYFLGAFMSQSLNSTFFTDAGKPGAGNPIIRGLIMAASGVVVTLSSSNALDNTPSAIGTTAAASGSVAGNVQLANGAQEFTLLLNGHKGTDPLYPNVLVASFDPDAPNYFGRMFNRNPLKMEQAGYVLYSDFPINSAIATVTGSGGIVNGSAIVGTTEIVAFVTPGANARNVGTTTAPNFENFADRYRTPLTPWITSQKFGGKFQNLFRIHAISDGVFSTDKLKVSISNVTPGNDADPYGTFDIEVRQFDDDDKSKKVVEVFRRLNLNPQSSNYIAKKIGDMNMFMNWDADIGRQELVVEGDYENRSRYIRVEMASSVTNEEINASALPFGFRGLQHMATSGSAPMPTLSGNAAGVFTSVVGSNDALKALIQPPIPMRENLNIGASPNQYVDKALYWGIQTTKKTSPTQPNSSAVQETAIKGFIKYYPDFQTNNMNFVVYDNEGASDTTTNGIADADRFNNNGFSLSNVQITYTPDSLGSPNGSPTTLNMKNWKYVREGGVTANPTNGTRELRVEDLKDPVVRQIAKFTVCFFGGFDGVRIFNEGTSLMNNNAISEELDNASRGLVRGSTYVAYDRAIDLVADALDTDIQLLVIPGIRNTLITDKALSTIENRTDAFYLMDVELYDQNNELYRGDDGQYVSIQNTITAMRSRGLNSSYGAAFFPDAIIGDELSGTTRQVAATVPILGAFALNDAVGYPWYAPAGFTRGALKSTKETTLILNRQNIDDLQEVDINPLVSFPGSQGVVVWGQKTLLASESALERINVRRLLVEIRRRLRPVANRIVFEPTIEGTVTRFDQLVEPIIRDIKQKKGVDNYVVKIDATTTTQQDLENRTIRGKIYIVPTRSLETVDIDFVLTNAV